MYHELLTGRESKRHCRSGRNRQLLSQELIVKSDPDFFFVSADRESDETGRGNSRTVLAVPPFRICVLTIVSFLEDRYIYASNCVYAVKAMANAAYGPLFDMSGEKTD